jgi:hypothetical protein
MNHQKSILTVILITKINKVLKNKPQASLHLNNLTPHGKTSNPNIFSIMMEEQALNLFRASYIMILRL